VAVIREGRAVQLEDYFDFEKFDTEFGPVDRIRLKDTRVDIEIVVEEFNEGVNPREIAENYPTLTLEQVYAAITYYLHNKADVDEYNRRGEEIADAYYQEHLKQPPDAVTLRLRALAAQRDAQEQGAAG
jgi:uncharacterized protein (DUF433 family)